MSFFKISKLKSVVDELIHVRLNLGKKQSKAVTFRSFIDDKTTRYSSLAYYLTDANDKSGTLDFSKVRSIGGSYLGVEPMAFLWALRPEPGSKAGSRLLRRDASIPLVVNLEAYQGHLKLPELSPEKLICSSKLERTYLAENVDRIPVKHGRIRGTLFVPKNYKWSPAVIDLFGMGGGIMEFRAALLASKGFLTLSLPYFGYEDLPVEYKEQDMYYFEEAIDFLLHHPKVLGNKVGVVGTSKGGEIACMMSSLFGDKIAATAVLNTIPYLNALPVTYENEYFPNYGFGEEHGFDETPRGISMRDGLTKHDVDAIIPVERSKEGQFLLVNCLDDYSVPLNTVDMLAERLTRAGKSNFKILRYPGAGHLLEPPFAPLCDVAYVKAFQMVVSYGGYAREHHEAQVHFWRELQDFLFRNVGVPKENDSTL